MPEMVYNDHHMEGFKQAGGLVDKTRFKRRPRYTVVLHDVREKLGLSLNTYVVIDSIHKLSTSDPKFPYCVMSKPNMAEFLQLGERTVYRSLNEAQQLGLIERGEHGLRATNKWIRMVEIYDIRS
jgi:hypothetical protein